MVDLSDAVLGRELSKVIDAWSEVQTILGIERQSAANVVARLFKDFELALYLDSEGYEGLWFPVSTKENQDDLISQLTLSDYAAGKVDEPGGWADWRILPSGYQQILRQTRSIATRTRAAADRPVDAMDAALPRCEPQGKRTTLNDESIERLTDTEDAHDEMHRAVTASQAIVQVLEAENRRLESEATRLSERLVGKNREIARLERALIRGAVLATAQQDNLEKRLAETERQIGNADRYPTVGAAGVTIHLPHMTKGLAAVFEVMRKHWTDYNKDAPPKSANVARDIDRTAGYESQKDGEASRNGQALAALIRPDELRDASLRALNR